VLHRIRQIDPAALDPGGLEGPVEDRAGRPDEGLTLDVLAVTGLLADQHQLRRAPACTEYGLGGVAAEGAAAAGPGGLAQRLEVTVPRQEFLGAHRRWGPVTPNTPGQAGVSRRSCPGTAGPEPFRVILAMGVAGEEPASMLRR
jgi:hypothetical protein